MLRIIQNSTATGAKSYYSTADYYTEGQELTGVWRGQAATRLGLTGEIAKCDWDALCDNRAPGTGEKLTPRQKDNRRVGYDFNFHVPKSVSLLYGLTQDERILSAFRAAVNATMQDIEAEMQSRVRIGGRDEDRTTGNMVWGEFVHTTARPVAGVPDPHLHAHCFVFNVTWDGDESRWKAGQFAGLKRDAGFFEAAFHARLSRSLAELGLPIERTRKGWELAGVSASTVAKFSRRTELIERRAREKGIEDPREKGELGAKTRSGKVKDMSLRALQEEWRSRLTEGEGDVIRDLASRIGGATPAEDPQAARLAVAEAQSHSFERSSVVTERALLATALRRGCGSASYGSVVAELARAPLIRGTRDGAACVTTREVLAEERKMVEFARRGRGRYAPLVPGAWTCRREWLGEDQRRAVQRIVASPDRVVLLRGGAGTGKTSLMQEAVEAIEGAGRRVLVFAPSADASRGVLRGEGFASADTVARLLLDEKLQEAARSQVLWIDEAGLLSSRDMSRLFALADRIDARVILSGDPRQHGSVERGTVLRLLEEEAGVVPAEVREIQRQKGDYRRAVQALAEARTEQGFRELDRLGWVREVPAEDRYQALARDYVNTVSHGKSALVVSPTHTEGARCTEEIRAALKMRGRIEGAEHVLPVLVNKNLTEAERRDAVNYAPGDVIVFHRSAKGFGAGQRVVVGDVPLPLEHASRFQAFKPGELPLAAGDVVRITRGGLTADGKHRLNNGALFTVAGLDRSGDIRLTNGWTVGREFGHLAHGYCVTSHASQGKTVDRVLIGQSSASLPATSREQFYVSVSRGREQAMVYTDDKAALMAAVSRGDDRATATELQRGRMLAMQRDQAADGRPAERARAPAQERAHG